MKKLTIGIIVIILILFLGYKTRCDIEEIETIKNHNNMNIEQVNACSEYLKTNPDGLCD